MGMLERYGGPAVFLGRFVAFARAIIPGLAGMSGLRYPVFLFYNALGGLIWGVGYTLLGYIVGVSFQRILTRWACGRWPWSAGGCVVVAVGLQLARSGVSADGWPPSWVATIRHGAGVSPRSRRSGARSG